MLQKIRAAIRAFRDPKALSIGEAVIWSLPIVKALEPIYPEEKDRYRWLMARQPSLGGASPFDKIRAGKTEEVLALIDQLKSGAFV